MRESFAARAVRVRRVGKRVRCVYEHLAQRSGRACERETACYCLHVVEEVVRRNFCDRGRCEFAPLDMTLLRSFVMSRISFGRLERLWFGGRIDSADF